MKLLSHSDTLSPADLQLANDADPLTQQLDGVHTIELHFPNFTDGRAFSQALMLRKRCGFAGDIRATGDVLVDQLSQMQRCGFSSAVLRALIKMLYFLPLTHVGELIFVVLLKVMVTGLALPSMAAPVEKVMLEVSAVAVVNHIPGDATLNVAVL